ncbi:formate dehydrogenase subunit delta [Enterovibrio makurazakiensis]|uniref:Formate dehydrogenase subunit delta n=1 Tax=Enterovibrio gelatinilyticus TaxID=2899819 RepID=A0ABT5R0E0_9GAMM|nr:formate dehydrogenase subunit delta [Enterovibrio sp. ZSDZ42]MDD1793742.1 formate dehydrogenase subunit delta [Enterovibrio sp. ZSDZ42]
MAHELHGELVRNQRLYDMANQIADNLVHGREQEDTIDEVASHIRRFWSLDMKESLFDAVDSEVLNPIAKQAAEKLALDYRK